MYRFTQPVSFGKWQQILCAIMAVMCLFGRYQFLFSFVRKKFFPQANSLNTNKSYDPKRENCYLLTSNLRRFAATKQKSSNVFLCPYVHIYLSIHENNIINYRLSFALAILFCDSIHRSTATLPTVHSNGSSKHNRPNGENQEHFFL